MRIVYTYKSYNNKEIHFTGISNLSNFYKFYNSEGICSTDCFRITGPTGMNNS